MIRKALIEHWTPVTGTEIMLLAAHCCKAEATMNAFDKDRPHTGQWPPEDHKIDDGIPITY